MDFQNNCLGLYSEYHGQGECYADDAPPATLVEPSITLGFDDDYTLTDGPTIAHNISSDLNSVPLDYIHNANPPSLPQVAEPVLSSTHYVSAEFGHGTQYYANNTAAPEGFDGQSHVAVEQAVPTPGPLYFGPAPYSYENIHDASSQLFSGSVDIGASWAYTAPNELPPSTYAANPGLSNYAPPEFHAHNSSETLTSQPVLETQTYGHPLNYFVPSHESYPPDYPSQPAAATASYPLASSTNQPQYDMTPNTTAHATLTALPENQVFSVQAWQQGVANIGTELSSSTAKPLTAQRSRPLVPRSGRAPTRTMSTGYHPYPKASRPDQANSSSKVHPRVYALARSGSNRGSPVAGPSSIETTPESFRSFQLFPSAPHTPPVATPPAPTSAAFEPTIVQPSNDEMTPANSVPSQATGQDLGSEFPTTFTQEQYNRLGNPKMWEEWIFQRVSEATEVMDTSAGPGKKQRRDCQYADPLVGAMRCFRKNCFDKDRKLLPKKGFCLGRYGLAEYLRHLIFHRYEERMTRKIAANDPRATRFYDAALDYQAAFDKSHGITYYWDR